MSIPASDDKQIILYDFPGKTAGGSYSYNAWKARLALNIKGLPYRTIWVDAPDIAAHCISINAPPSSYATDPSTGAKTPLYTFPVIHDPATGATVSDSMRIGNYLDETYPLALHDKATAVLDLKDDRLVLVPEGTEALNTMFEQLWMDKIGKNLFPMFVADLAEMGATARWRAAFRKKREAIFGMKLEEVIPDEEAKAKQWKKVLGEFAQLSEWFDAPLDETGVQRRFLMGRRVSWPDLLVGSWMLLIKRMWGEESQEFKELMSVDGGRWARYFEVFKNWDYVDDEGKASLTKWWE